MIRDDVAVNNERLKLLAGFLNALGLALIGVGFLAPMVGASTASYSPTWWTLWLVIGLALHGAAHYLLGHLKKGAPS